MNARFFSLVVTIVLGLAPATGWGQSFVNGGYGYGYGGSRHGGYGHGFGYGNNYRFASTYEEGVLNGYSNLLQGRGLYEKYHAEALIGFQQARTIALENDQTALKARLEALDLRKQRVAEETQQIAERNRLAQQQKSPAKVAPKVVRPDGEVTWPVELRGKQFAPFREAIDADFAALATGDAEAALTIRSQLDKLVAFASAKVRSQEMEGSSLMAAISFRDKAQHAARHWAGNANGATTAVAASY